MGRYDKMTTENFDQILHEIVGKYPASNLLSVPGVYEAVSEHFNNEVLAQWASEQPVVHYRVHGETFAVCGEEGEGVQMSDREEDATCEECIRVNEDARCDEPDIGEPGPPPVGDS